MADPVYSFNPRSVRRIAGTVLRDEARSRYADRLPPPPRPPEIPWVVNLTSQETGGGKYGGKSCVPSRPSGSTANATDDLDLPEGLLVAEEEDCLVINAD
jgi:hypothetical protein